MRKLVLAVLAAFIIGQAAPAAAAAEGAKRVHVVANGQRLGSIAKRYNVTIEAICYANDIRQRDPIKPGQKLVIPSREDKDGSIARAQHLRETGGAKTVNASVRSKKERDARQATWQEYARKPPRKSFVQLASHQRKWRGLALDAKGRIRGPARQGIQNLLGANGDHPGAPDRLLRLLVQVSDTFGGRPIYIVSGYRTTSHYLDSRHKTSQAIDFSVTGVPNAVVRDYLRTLPSVGVGYYPNSTFLHLDVRPSKTYWVDYAGPGEAPRKTPRGTIATTPSDLDELAEERAESKSTTPDDAAEPPENHAESATPSP